MASVKINGQDASLNISGIDKLSELVELVKAIIDPEQMISSIAVDGRDLEDHEWGATLSQFETSVFEIETDFPINYVCQRLDQASSIVKNCFMQFRSARKCFQVGEMTEANKRLVSAVNTLNEFFRWYYTLAELLDEKKKKALDLTVHMNGISEICKRISQQQLYQSWWAIGETLEKELEPSLDKLEDACIKINKNFPLESQAS